MYEHLLSQLTYERMKLAEHQNSKQIGAYTTVRWLEYHNICLPALSVCEEDCTTLGCSIAASLLVVTHQNYAFCFTIWHSTCWSANCLLSRKFDVNWFSKCPYMLSKMDAILCRPCISYSYVSKCPQKWTQKTKFWLGEHVPRPHYSCMLYACIHAQTFQGRS